MKSCRETRQCHVVGRTHAPIVSAEAFMWFNYVMKNLSLGGGLKWGLCKGLVGYGEAHSCLPREHQNKKLDLTLSKCIQLDSNYIETN